MRRLAFVVLAAALVSTGCATAKPVAAPAADVAGQWAGSWTGYGVANIPRREPARLRITEGGTPGHGWLTLENTNAADSVPKTLRFSGLAGSPVQTQVSGSKVTVTHDLGDSLFVADLTVDGDRMTGTVRDTYPPVHLTLERVKPPAPPVRSEAPAPPTVALAPPPPTPQAPPPVPVPSERPAPLTFSPVPELKAIHFEFDRFEIRPGDAQTLDTNAQWLKSNKDTDVIIEGHCDERGTNEYNIALGERRARTTRDYLISQGVEAARITTISYGEDRPVCTEHTEACWLENRRVEFKARPR
jgi:peptidoglycan-associated lipoprotein